GAVDLLVVVVVVDGLVDVLLLAFGRRHRPAFALFPYATLFRSGVVHGVGPHPVGADRELAEAIAAGHVGLRHKGRGAVHVGGRRCAAGAPGVEDTGQRSRVGAGDHRRVVGAVDGHGDGLRRAGG